MIIPNVWENKKGSKPSNMVIKALKNGVDHQPWGSIHCSKALIGPHVQFFSHRNADVAAQNGRYGRSTANLKVGFAGNDTDFSIYLSNFGDSAIKNVDLTRTSKSKIGIHQELG